jgi:hypothetical protein
LQSSLIAWFLNLELFRMFQMPCWLGKWFSTQVGFQKCCSSSAL